MEEPLSGIYCITNIVNGKKYVGQSDNLKRRIKSHKQTLKNNRHHNSHLQRAWNKYGDNNFEFKVIEICNIDNLDEREVHWINMNDSFKNGYNQSMGGNGNRGWKVSEETKQRMRNNHADVSGKNNPMSGKNAFDFMTEEEVVRLRKKRKYQALHNNPFKGRRHTEVAKKKQSESHMNYFRINGNPLKGRKRSDETIRRISDSMRGMFPRGDNPNAKKITCLNTGETFYCIQDGANKYRANRSSISSCISHKTHSAGVLETGEKLVWRQYNEYITMSEEDIKTLIDFAQNSNKGKNKPNSQTVICITTNEIFDTTTEAAKYFNTDNSSIGKCCKGKMKTAGIHPVTNEKLQWKYYNKALSGNDNIIVA